MSLPSLSLLLLFSLTYLEKFSGAVGGAVRKSQFLHRVGRSATHQPAAHRDVRSTPAASARSRWCRPRPYPRLLAALRRARAAEPLRCQRVG